MTAQRKRFRIETHPAYAYRSAFDEPEAQSAGEGRAEDAATRHRELMDAIASLEASLLRGVVAAPAGAECEAPQPAPAPYLGDGLPCMSEVRQLKSELDCMQAAITRTKKEIAAIHTKGPQNAHVTSATDQLDAVVEGTEKATTSILGAAEEIDQMAAMLQHSLQESQDKAMAEDIQHQVVKIFEACN
jgi:chemotaxis protein CheZ